MNRYLSGLVSLFMTFSLSGQEMRETSYWVVPTVEHPSEYKNYLPGQSISIDMVKGETEHIQVVLKTIPGEILRFKRVTHKKGLTIHFRQLQDINGYADALVPCKQELICTDTLTTVWISYQTTVKSMAREDRETVLIESHRQQHRVKVNLRVRHIALPLQPTIPTVAGVEMDKLSEGYNGKALDEEKQKWVDFILNYRIAPMFGKRLSAERWQYDHSFSPWDWNDKRTRKLLEDKRYAAFVLPYFVMKPHELKEMVNYVEKKKKLEQSFFYIWDEPAYVEDYQSIRAKADSIHALQPKAKVMTTFFCGPRNGNRQGDLYAVYDELQKEIQIFAMSLAPHKANEANIQAARLRAPAGSTWWSYICWEPGGSEPNFLLSMKGMQQRAVMWRTWKNKSEGFLYWDMNIYHQRKPYTYITDMPHGDGQLIYPGDVFGVDEPVASVRLERWRDGAEEAELLYMLRQRGKEKEAEQILQKVYVSPTEYIENGKWIPLFRKELMNEVER